jgi:hypothetical protein
MAELTPEKQALADAAESPTAEYRIAEIERVNTQVKEIVAGYPTRKFCVEQAVIAACHNPAVVPEKLVEDLWRFMTADLSRLH